MLPARKPERTNLRDKTVLCEAEKMQAAVCCVTNNNSCLQTEKYEGSFYSWRKIIFQILSHCAWAMRRLRRNYQRQVGFNERRKKLALKSFHIKIQPLVFNQWWFFVGRRAKKCKNPATIIWCKWRLFPIYYIRRKGEPEI